MDIKIGKKIFFFIALCLNWHTHTKNEEKIELIAVDNNRQPIDTAQIGVPFILQVIAYNIDAQSDVTGIHDTDSYQVQFAYPEQQTSIFNGHKTQRTTYNY